MPYWAMSEARGSPEGNFPTWRTMTGALAASTGRKPRMLGRQTFGYAVEYLLTGDPEKLALVRAGSHWILDHARDGTVGGWFADLDANGNASGAGAKLTQDTAYTVMGPAAYFFVTRDPEAEAGVEQTLQLLFDPATYFDANGKRLRDGMNASLTAEAFLNGNGNDIVSQLDPITAFMLLVQPVRTQQSDRDRMLDQLRHPCRRHPRSTLLRRVLLGEREHARLLAELPQRLRAHAEGSLGAHPDRQAPRRSALPRLPRDLDRRHAHPRARRHQRLTRTELR